MCGSWFMCTCRQKGQTIGPALDVLMAYRLTITTITAIESKNGATDQRQIIEILATFDDYRNLTGQIGLWPTTSPPGGGPKTSAHKKTRPPPKGVAGSVCSDRSAKRIYTLERQDTVNRERGLIVVPALENLARPQPRRQCCCQPSPSGLRDGR